VHKEIRNLSRIWDFVTWFPSQFSEGCTDQSLSSSSFVTLPNISKHRKQKKKRSNV
jgi:hypothetical protein